MLNALESDVLSFVSITVANDIWVFADSTHRIIFSINLIIHEAAVGVFSHKPLIMSSFACSRGRMHDELEPSVCNVRKTRSVLHKSTNQMQDCTGCTWSLVASFCFVNSPCYGWYNPMHLCFMASCCIHASLEMFKEISDPLHQSICPQRLAIRWISCKENVLEQHNFGIRGTFKPMVRSRCKHNV